MAAMNLNDMSRGELIDHVASFQSRVEGLERELERVRGQFHEFQGSAYQARQELIAAHEKDSAAARAEAEGLRRELAASHRAYEDCKADKARLKVDNDGLSRQVAEMFHELGSVYDEAGERRHIGYDEAIAYRKQCAEKLGRIAAAARAVMDAAPDGWPAPGASLQGRLRALLGACGMAVPPLAAAAPDPAPAVGAEAGPRIAVEVLDEPGDEEGTPALEPAAAALRDAVLGALGAMKNRDAWGLLFDALAPGLLERHERLVVEAMTRQALQDSTVAFTGRSERDAAAESVAAGLYRILCEWGLYLAREDD